MEVAWPSSKVPAQQPLHDRVANVSNDRMPCSQSFEEPVLCWFESCSSPNVTNSLQRCCDSVFVSGLCGGPCGACTTTSPMEAKVPRENSVLDR